MASHIYTITPEAVGAADGDSPAIFLWHFGQPEIWPMEGDEPGGNGDGFRHGPISPAQARELAIALIEAAYEAEDLADSMVQA